MDVHRLISQVITLNNCTVLYRVHTALMIEERIVSQCKSRKGWEHCEVSGGVFLYDPIATL